MSTNTLSVVTSRISLDISRMDIQNNIPVTQGDTKRRLEVTLMNAGQPLAVNENWTVVLVGIKPDGSKISNMCDVENGKIIYDFAKGDQIATAAGAFYIQFNIFDEVGELLGTPKIWLSVVANAIREMESTDQLQALQDVIRLANENEENRTAVVMAAIERSEEVNQNHEAAEAARVLAEQGRVDAEASRVLAEKGRADAEASRVLAEQGRVNAETSRIQAEVSREQTANETIQRLNQAEEDFRESYQEAEDERDQDAANAVQSLNNKEAEIQENEQVRISNENARKKAENEREALKAALEKLKADLQELVDALPDRVAELPELVDRINAVLDSDDVTLDELSEIVAYIKNNKSLIESVTISKVNVSDIIDNLVTNASNKPLSAAQGVKLKGLVDTAQTTANEAKTAASNAQTTANGKEAAGTAAGLINRTTKVNAADTNYTTLMARGVSLNSAETTPAVNGAIAWTFE